MRARSWRSRSFRAALLIGFLAALSWFAGLNGGGPDLTRPALAQSNDLLPPLPDPALLTDPVWARPGYAGLANGFAGRTRYLLALHIDHRRGLMTGRARILFVNRSPVALDAVVLRLYPNHPVHAGRQMRLGAVSVNGAPVNGTFRDSEQTSFGVPLGTQLAPGGSATIDVDYTISVPQTNFYYVSEPFPMVAVYDPARGWREEVATKGLDYVYSESALMAVNLRAPTEVGTWFVGAIKTAQDNGDGTTTYSIVTGPVRNFLVLQARGWNVIARDDGPVPIRVLYSGNRVVADEITQLAFDAMVYFDNTFGPYPYAEFDVIAMRFPSGGEEYPGIVFINNERDTIYRRFIVLHEVAHQWFYGIAGNDTLRSAWLDESLAQIAGYLFHQDTNSQAVADVYWQSILTWYNRIQTVRPINTPLEEFRDFADYMSTVYGGGAVFLRDLSELMGHYAFKTGLRVYVQTVGLGVGTPEQFFSAVQAQTNINLRPIFCQRVGILC